MPRYRMLVLSRPVEGREEEFNEWYQHTHLKQIVAIPGFVSAQRFKMASNMRGDSAWPYAAIYDIETDDIEATRREMETRAMDERIARCAAFDYDSVYASIYEPLGEVVEAE